MDYGQWKAELAVCRLEFDEVGRIGQRGTIDAPLLGPFRKASLQQGSPAHIRDRPVERRRFPFDEQLTVL